MTGGKVNMLYLLFIPVILVGVAYLMSRELYTSRQAQLVCTAGWSLVAIGLGMFILWSYSPNTLVFFIVMGAVPAFALTGVAIVEGAGKVEQRERRIAQQRREAMFDPFTR